MTVDGTELMSNERGREMVELYHDLVHVFEHGVAARHSNLGQLGVQVHINVLTTVDFEDLTVDSHSNILCVVLGRSFFIPTGGHLLLLDIVKLDREGAAHLPKPALREEEEIVPVLIARHLKLVIVVLLPSAKSITLIARCPCI